MPGLNNSAIHEYDFNDIAEKFDDLQKELQKANARLSQQQADIQNLNEALASKTRDLASREKTLLKATKENERLSSDLKKERRQFSESQSRLKAQHASALAKEKGLCAQLQEEYKIQTESLNELEARYVNTKFDLEYLKCVAEPSAQALTLSGRHREILLPPQPFVVVLVDGDAYDVS